MGAPHGHLLHYHAHSPVHRLPAHLKIAVLLGFVLLVVATPAQEVWAFAAYAGLVLGVALVSRVPLPYLLVRMVVEVPFVVFAVLMPFISTGPRVALGPLLVSEPGLWAAWALLAKGTLGVFTSLLLATTTEPREVVAGLQRLRMPATLVQILAFMIRYLEVVAGEMHRMRIARESRGFRPGGLRAWPVIARSAGALFIRSYERGERVHLAMLSRGYAGRLPETVALTASPAQWVAAAALPGAAALVLIGAVGW
ncbi:MAG: cobalt ECF transporter T component CbiQ [Actinomycetota bacterium]|jgi:cobalt/nickel transport system permease protein|nr:cobalt ECF transporter T component CbiQ [Actinomycetota bacterium]MDQ3382281.1 cobalt ECF transporter T component CbiQ [Actinomycetota bacterium]MDQ3526436.1 cobalt ECF transporter T component CbiQ [Actinomycetota bacterium]